MKFLFGVLVAAEFFGFDLGKDEQINSFSMIGDATVLGNVVRIVTNDGDVVGGIQSLETIETGLLEIEIAFNIRTNKAGVGFWFSSQIQELGPIFGLSQKFQGFGVFLETKSSTLYLADIRELSENNLKSGEKCLITLKNTNLLKLYVKSATFEVWIQENSFTKCGEIKIQAPKNVYFGIHSRDSQIDIIKVQKVANFPEPIKNDEFSPIHYEVSQKLSLLNTKLPTLKQNINFLFSGPEFEKLHSDIHNLKEKIQKLLKILPPLHKTLSEMHIEDRFTQYSNIEILSINEQVKKINLRMEELMDYVDSKKILSEVYDAVEDRYKKLSSHGSMLKKDLKQAEKNFKSFEKHFESDARMFWVHIGLGVLVFLSCFMCCKTCANDTSIGE